MNEKYIRRQLTIKDLDIPMSKKIIEFYDSFNEILQNEVGRKFVFDDKIEYYNSSGYNNIMYDKSTKSLWLKYIVWEKIYQSGLNKREIYPFLEDIVKNTLDVEVERIW